MTLAGAAPSFPDDAVGSAIRQRLDETLFVEAGAGTGKTTNLVARIVELVVAGNELRGIAAITFTEAAAAELRDRVRRALVDASLAGRIPAEVAARVDDAMISTLHAFAHRLLAEHPLEAGLPPAIEVLDEIESSLELDERWRAFADELFTRPDLEDVLLRAFALDISVDRLAELASVLHQQRDRLDPTAPPPGPLPPVDPTPVLEALRCAHRLAEHCTSPADKLADHLAELDCAEQRLAAATDELELLHLLRWLDKFAKPTLGQAGNWACDVEEVRAATEAADHARWSLLGRIKTDVLDRLLHEVSRFVDEAAAARRAEGRLLFHDLLVLARDLLRDRPDVRSRARQRWSHLLIDEFQDTDPLQVELAVLLASDQPPERDDWPELGLVPGRLFFVGDPKQSIYRFRRADIELFHRVRDHATETPLQLTTNRRSVPGILAWVNAVFGVLLGAETTATQARYEPLVAARTPLPGRSQVPSVTVLGRPWAEPIDRVRAREAPELAAVIRQVVDEGWAVVGSDGGVRPAGFGDVAVLLPTRTGLSHLEDALDAADIPYRVESSTLVWSGQQVRDLLSILRAVDDTTDEVALVAALRSPVLACSDDDLLAFRRAGGRWNLRAPLPEGLPEDHPVARAMARLRVVHDRRWWTGVSALVDEVARDFGFFELALDQRRPRDHWRRLRFVVEQARAFEATTGATLRRFLDWAALQATDAARVREPVLHEPDDDAVRVLTVHGAKGLEFPVTVLAGLSRERNKGGRPVRVLWDDDGTLQVRLGAAAQTAGYGSVADLDEARDREEQIRLLYVAATRARDHLIVSLHHKEGRDCHARQLLPLCEAHADLIRRPDPPPAPTDPPRTVEPAPPPGSPPPGEDRLVQRRAFEQGRAALVERLGRQPVLAATTVAAGADGDPALRRIRPRARRGDRRDGSAVGRAVHALLETVDLGAEGGFEDLAAELAAAEGVPDQAAEVAGLVAAALVSDPVRQARQGRHWREVYVAAPVGDAVIEGFVDLLYETDDGLVVIDYKTDFVADGSIDAAVERYRLQVAAYAAALEVAVGRPVAAAGLLFLAEGSSQTRFVPDLAGAITEVAAKGVILDR